MLFIFIIIITGPKNNNIFGEVWTWFFGNFHVVVTSLISYLDLFFKNINI